MRLAFPESCDKLRFMRLLTALAAFVALGVGALAAPPLPRPAKELEIDTPNGQHLLLSSYRGKVVIVQFLYTTCPHCQAYSQLLTKLETEYGPKGFQALGGAFNEATNAMVSAYVNQYHVGFPVGVMQRETVISFMSFSLLDRLVVPQIALIDRKGQIREQSEANPTQEPPLQMRPTCARPLKNFWPRAPRPLRAARPARAPRARSKNRCLQIRASSK